MIPPPAVPPLPPPAELHADVAVIGGGVIGHGIAWEARRSGRSVVVIDDAPGSGASWAAAGMLAPVSELHYQEEDLLELMLESSGQWPAFAADLARDAPDDSGYLATPTLAIGADAADRRALMDLRAVQLAHGLAIEPLTVREARSREPLLSPAISCALDIPADHQVDPRQARGMPAPGVGQPRRRSTFRSHGCARRFRRRRPRVVPGVGGRPGYRRQAGGRGTGDRRGNRGGQRAASGLPGRIARRAPVAAASGARGYPPAARPGTPPPAGDRHSPRPGPGPAGVHRSAA